MFRLIVKVYKALLLFYFNKPAILGYLDSIIVREVTIKANFVFYVGI
jgi:hypothetical protein